MNNELVKNEVELLFTNQAKSDADKLCLLASTLNVEVKNENDMSFLKNCFLQFNHNKNYNNIKQACKELIKIKNGERIGNLYGIIYKAMEK